MSKILLIVTNQVGQPQMLSLTLHVWWVGCFFFFFWKWGKKLLNSKVKKENEMDRNFQKASREMQAQKRPW